MYDAFICKELCIANVHVTLSSCLPYHIWFVFDLTALKPHGAAVVGGEWGG